MSDGRMLLSRIVIERYLTEEGRDLVDYEAADATGGDLSIVEILGLLEFTKDTALHTAAEDAE